MTLTNQQLLTSDLHPTISPERLGTYLLASNRDDSRALKLYIWNAHVGEAFHLPIQATEVALRNTINGALVRRFGADWWNNAKFLAVASARQRKDITDVTRRIQKRGSTLCTGQIVANLSFGFWAGMLDSSYNISIWSRELSSAFPHLPNKKKRKQVATRVRKVNNFRNRIWHHEPIFRMNLSQEYADAMELLGWICPTKLGWVKPHCRVPALLRQKP